MPTMDSTFSSADHVVAKPAARAKPSSGSTAKKRVAPKQKVESTDTVPAPAADAGADAPAADE